MSPARPVPISVTNYDKCRQQGQSQYPSRTRTLLVGTASHAIRHELADTCCRYSQSVMFSVTNLDTCCRHCHVNCHKLGHLLPLQSFTLSVTNSDTRCRHSQSRTSRHNVAGTTTHAIRHKLGRMLPAQRLTLSVINYDACCGHNDSRYPS